MTFLTLKDVFNLRYTRNNQNLKKKYGAKFDRIVSKEVLPQKKNCSSNGFPFTSHDFA